MTSNEMTVAARAGYDGYVNPYMYSSPLWYAHECGKMLHATGRPVPTDVRMSRGYSVRVRDMVFKHSDTAGWERVA